MDRGRVWLHQQMAEEVFGQQDHSVFAYLPGKRQHHQEQLLMPQYWRLTSQLWA